MESHNHSLIFAKRHPTWSVYHIHDYDEYTNIWLPEGWLLTFVTFSRAFVFFTFFHSHREYLEYMATMAVWRGWAGWHEVRGLGHSDAWK